MSERQPGLKRSAAIQIIKDFLRVYEDPGFDEEREDDADALLSNLLNAGMRPPMRDADQRSSYGYARIQEWENE